jgi:hypothetical protein
MSTGILTGCPHKFLQIVYGNSDRFSIEIEIPTDFLWGFLWMFHENSRKISVGAHVIVKFPQESSKIFHKSPHRSDSMGFLCGFIEIASCGLPVRILTDLRSPVGVLVDSFSVGVLVGFP